MQKNQYFLKYFLQVFDCFSPKLSVFERIWRKSCNNFNSRLQNWLFFLGFSISFSGHNSKKTERLAKWI